LKKEVAFKLEKTALEIADRFSRWDREHNNNKEIFNVAEIIPLSENTAAVILEKNTGKRAIAFCYYLNTMGGVWRYFIPTDSHLLGLERLKNLVFEIEKHNYQYNFKDIELEANI